MKMIVLLTILAVFVLRTNAQTQNVDSLKEQLTLKLSDTSRLIRFKTWILLPGLESLIVYCTTQNNYLNSRTGQIIKE